MNYVGSNGVEFLFVEGSSGVVINEKTKKISFVEDCKSLMASGAFSTDITPARTYVDLAKSSFSELDITVLSASDRMYTIPKGVITEAKRGLEWRKEFNRGGTNVGLNTARTLAKGGQIGIKKVRHIAKYFPRHEVDKRGKGYKPGQDGYPSAGRIAWALWGGDAAQKWASAIVERDNKAKKSASLVSGGYEGFHMSEVTSFDDDRYEFFIRMRTDGSGIDRLYRVAPDGTCVIWDDGCWDDLGNISHDFETYDKSLDDPYDKSQKIHVPVDKNSAVVIAAMMDNDPLIAVTVKSINFEETSLVEAAIPDEDWGFIDQLADMDDLPDESDLEDDDGLTAAGGFQTNQDGVYTPEERSEKAKQQVRDATGKFAKSGSTVVIGGDPNKTGKIVSINGDTQEVGVELRNGETVSVPASLTESAETFEPVSTANFPASNLDFSGILGEPRVPIDQPQAMLPGRLPPLTASDTNLLVSDWSAWVADQRLSPEYSGDPVKPFIPKALPDPNSVMGRYFQGAFNPDGTPKGSWNPAIASNVYNEPLLRDWLDTKYRNKSGESGYHNRGWYTPKPDLAPIEPKKSRDETLSKSNRDRLDDKYNPVNFSIIAAAEKELTPETSDVPPMYLAIVAEDDPQAVMELAALIPASKTSTKPSIFIRRDRKWVRDERLLNDIQSVTPPPVVVLDNETLSDVIDQMEGASAPDSQQAPADQQPGTPVQASGYPDVSVLLSRNGAVTALVAKGGLDRNRGNAERLRRYWKYGPGALKIRWNTPGDWTRCYRQLAKYMGPRAKGYCSLRHKEMTGTWPGSKYNIGKKRKSRVASLVSAIESVKSEEMIINEFVLRARAESARSRLKGGRSGASPSDHGAKFIIPLVIPEMKESGDKRIFNKGAISFRDLPLPLLWQVRTGQGHDGSVVVGQILSMERTSEGIGNAYGVFDSGEFGSEAERLVRHGFIRGVSADMDQFEADEETEEEISENGETTKVGTGRITITKARVMAVTIVPKPAFQECFIQIIDQPASAEEDSVVPDGTYIDGVKPQDAAALIACGMVAGAIPVEPPSEWFEDPKLSGPTPLTVSNDGRVFGHIAAWHVDHIGMAYGTKPPRSRSNYAYFHTGVVQTFEGDTVPVGQLTLSGGHAGLEASAEEAVRHYDDTASAVADVHAGEDAFGIWVAGSLRPGVTPEQIRALRASAPSGDWRPIKGRLELVAVCQVNVPGFPIARARVASGQVMALVAAGAGVLAEMKHDPLAEVIRKVEELEKKPLIAAAEEARARFANLNSEIMKERHAELAARMREKMSDDSVDGDPDDYMNQMFDDDPTSEMAVISRRVRERLAKEGKALDDGSYPIRNVSDLKNAIRAYGRSKPGKRAKVRKHIMKRARALGKSDLVPDKWSTASIVEEGLESSDLRERVAFAASKLASLTAAVGNDADDVDELLEDLTPEEIEAIKQQKRQQDALPDRDEDGRIKYTPQTQPRDASGKFRRVLARLKSDLGAAGLQRVVEKVEEAENLDNAGNYTRAADSANDLIGIIDRIDARALNPEALENVREGARELGEVIANLPFAFGEDAEKIRFSDVPPALRKLMEDMIDRVEEKIGQEDADIATEKLRSFMSGGDYFNQGEISSEMAKLLRLLT